MHMCKLSEEKHQIVTRCKQYTILLTSRKKMFKPEGGQGRQEVGRKEMTRKRRE